VNNSSLKIDNTDMPILKTGVDYGHLDMKNIDLAATNLFYDGDSAAANVQHLSLNEKSGLVLTESKGDASVSSKGIALNNLYLKTPTSELRRSIAFSYPVGKGVPSVDLDLENSKIAVKDIVTLAPQLKSNPALKNTREVWTVDGKVKGPLDDLMLTDLRFSGLSNTSFMASGRLKGLPDANKIQADLTIPYLNTTRSDIVAALPANTLPSNITLPDRINLKGRVKGGMENLYTNVNISSNLGSVAVNGTFKHLNNPKTIQYDVAIVTNNLDLGVILQDKKTYGPTSANFSIQGQGTDFTTANIKLNGGSTSFTYNGYTYRNIKLTGTIANKKFDITADVHDPNADFTAHANGIYNGINTSLKISSNIDSIKTQPLHFSTDVAVYRGKIEGDFANINPDSLSGKLAITKATIVNNGQRFMLDSTSLVAEHNGNTELIKLQTQFMYAEIKGQYKLTQLADILQQSIDPYYNLTAKRNTNKVDAHDFTINAKIYDHPALRAFIPSITRLDSVAIAMSFSTANGVNGSIDAPMIVYDTYEIAGLKVNADTKNDRLNFNTSFNRFRSGKQIAIYATTLNGTIANNTIDFSTTIKDNKGKNKYALSATFTQPTTGNYVFHLKPGTILLNYNSWTVNADNTIGAANGDISANNFILSKGDQQLTINTIGSGKDHPVSLDFKNFEISTLTAFVQVDSALIGGRMTGNLLVKDYKTQPTFTANLTIDDFNMNKDTLGTVVAKVNNNTANVYATDIKLTGRGNDVSITGNYYEKPANNSDFDLTIDVRALQMKALEGPTMNAIQNASGTINGQIALQGTLNNPVIDGRLNFNNAAFNVTALNSYFKVNNEQLRVHNGGLNFDNFIIKDSADNELKLNGDLLTGNFADYQFDLSITSDNFQVINTTKKQNKLFYGKLVLTTDLYVHGTSDKPIVDGTITVNDKTAFSVLLPQNDPAIEERNGVVRFVNLKATSLDSLFLQPYDSLNVSKFKGYDIAVNVQIDKNASFSLIVDESNGDFINLKGEADLTAGIDPSGKINFVGTYEITEGYYEITFKFLKRRFNIQKGSKIVWNGEPTKADIDVSGVYVANASPIDLVETQISDASNIIKNTYRQKLPFEVWLSLKGEMMQPEITFDIKLPEEKNYNVSREIIDNVEYKLKELETEPSEMNKQVFALILLNRFVNENPFDNSNGAFDVQNYAMSSVSKLLTDQLNNLAKGLIEGVDLNFDLVTTADYTTGDKRNRTDFNVGLTKRLLNDRLTVTVGSDFELQGPKPQNQSSTNTTADVAVDYMISRNGRYALRVYRKNDYQGIIEGYIIETGIAFRINVDYNHFAEIFKSAKARKNSKATPAADDKKKVAVTNTETR
jgi:translocation and assembly module TamB